MRALDFGYCGDLGFAVATPVSPEEEQNRFALEGWVEVGSGFAFESEYVDGLLDVGLERKGFGFCEFGFEEVESLVAFALAREESSLCFDRRADCGAEESVFFGVCGDDTFGAFEVGCGGCRLVQHLCAPCEPGEGCGAFGGVGICGAEVGGQSVGAEEISGGKFIADIGNYRCR